VGVNGFLGCHGSQKEFFQGIVDARLIVITGGRRRWLGLCACLVVERTFKFGDPQQENAFEVVDGGRVGCTNSLQAFKGAAKVLDFVDGGHRASCLWLGIHGNEQIVPLIFPTGSDLRHRAL
jgi:hypothetical protein